MCVRASIVRARRAAPQAGRPAFSLLEVLVACGIVIFALAGIAAILPAAGTIVADGVGEDRAAALAANVIAELRSRDLLRASALASGSQALVLGFLGNPPVWITGTNPAFKEASALVVAPLVTGSGDTIFHRAWPYRSSTIIAANADNYRGFFLEDDLVTISATAGPLIGYEGGNLMTGSGAGPRRFRRGTAWGATLTTGSLPPASGSVATLSLATFKKAADVAPIFMASGTIPNMYRLARDQQTILKTYLRPGAYCLAVPAPGSVLPPAWFQVSSSWTVKSGTSFIVLNTQAADPSLYEQTISSTKGLSAIGFSGLIRLDQVPVILK